MNQLNRKLLPAALAVGFVGAADAVNVSVDGLGQVLIYPYYTAQANPSNGGFNTLLSVVNHTSLAKVARVRFLEGKNGREVLDFNLFLSPLDAWTAAIIPDPNGGAKMITSDTSCTIPPIPVAGQSFVNYAYASDGAGGGLDRTKEGYFEIIEMGVFAPSTTTAANVTHVNGVPPGCPPGVSVASFNDTQAATDISPLQGGMSGTATLINVLAGAEASYNATVLDNFYTVGSNYESSGLTMPDLTQATPPVSVVPAGGSVYQTTWSATTADAVSAVLMHDSILNEFVLDSPTQSRTDWITTFPTKRFYVNRGTGAAPRLFQRNFNATAGSCDDVYLYETFDREGQIYATTGFPEPPPTPPDQLCWTSNILTFNDRNALSSVNSWNVSTTFQHGWLNLSFFPSTVVGLAHRMSVANVTSRWNLDGSLQTGLFRDYYGLPVVGSMVQAFSNGTNVVNGAAVLQNYAGAFPHRYTTSIQ